jgi:hypothetical protein
MGIFSYIADSFTNRGALDLVTAKDKETLANTAFLNETKPITQAFTPQANNLVAQEFAQQTMTALPRTAQELDPGQMGPPLPNAQTYSDPAAATRRYYDRLADQERARETARAQEQLSDPMFRFRDTMTDVARNTVGLPFNILSGGEAFSNDPSREAQSRHEARLEELDKLNGKNAELYDAAKDGRFATLENFKNQREVAGTNRLNALNATRLKASGTPRPDSEGFFIQAFDDGTSVRVTDTAGSPVRALDSSKIHMVAGVPHRYDPATQQFTPTVDADKVYNMKLDEAESAFMGQKRAEYLTQRPVLLSAIQKDQGDFDDLQVAINGARRILTKHRDQLDGATDRNGYEGLLRMLPNSEARELEGYFETIRSNQAIFSLSALRNSSPTGAGVGNTTQMEIQMFMDNKGKLNSLTTGTQNLEALDTIERAALRSLASARASLESRDMTFELTEKELGYTSGQERSVMSAEEEADLDAKFGLTPANPGP